MAFIESMQAYNFTSFFTLGQQVRKKKKTKQNTTKAITDSISTVIKSNFLFFFFAE